MQPAQKTDTEVGSGISTSQPRSLAPSKRFTFRLSRLRLVLAIILALLGIANGVVQLDKNINPSSRFRWDSSSPSSTNQAQPKTDIEADTLQRRVAPSLESKRDNGDS
jgi:hypothetical protein